MIFRTVLIDFTRSSSKSHNSVAMDIKRSFSKEEEIVDTVTPLYVHLSAKYARSFAYYTVNTRLPVILTKVIDHLARDKDQIVQQHGEPCGSELKEIIGTFSKLKNELQTNKLFVPLTSEGTDEALWNKYLEERSQIENDGPRWYSTIWLYAECYMYRRFREAFELSTTLKFFDPFRKQKEMAYNDSMLATSALGEHFLEVLGRSSEMKQDNIKKELLCLLMVNLWGNSCDLSISLGEVSTTRNILEQIEELQKNVLVNESDKIWSSLVAVNKSSPGHIAIICDNVGFELFTDLCLADFLITFSLANQITFHLKSIPWFISDVMPHDFHWTIESLATSGGCLSDLAQRWQGYVDSGKWRYEADEFWTSPFDFSVMQDINPELYSKLACSKLVIFKGDLNYRKLLGEINCRPTKSFHEALGPFHPTNLAALRTVKCDLICGLERDESENLYAKNPDWMKTGEYGVIQFDG